MREILQALGGGDAWTMLLALPPGAFWLWYVYRLDRYRPEPWWLVTLVFVLGAFSTQGVHWIGNLQEDYGFPWPHNGWIGLAATFIIAVGMVEEGCKMLVTWPVIRWVSRVDEVVDAVVLSGAAALGFATLENMLYVARHGPEVMAGRAILSTFGHVLMSSVWGFALGYVKVHRPRHGYRIVLLGWIGAAFVHGLYDLLLEMGMFPLAVLLLFGLWRWFVSRIQGTYPDSPHRPRVARRVRECPLCHALARTGAQFCSACSRPLPPTPGEAFCSACLKAVASEGPACASCSATLL